MYMCYMYARAVATRYAAVLSSTGSLERERVLEIYMYR